MIITIESPSGKRKWRLEPFDNGLCWRLLKTSINPKAKSQWINCECYPTTLPGALKALVDRMLKDPEDPVALDFKAEDVEKQAMRVLKAWLKQAGIEVENHEQREDS